MTNTSGEPIEGVAVRHLDHLRIRNLSPNTTYGRRRTLVRLRRWAGGEILYLTEDQLFAWQADRSREIKPQSLRGEQSHIREFYRWCVRERFRDDDPTVRLDMPRVARGMPRPMRDDRYARALASAPLDVRLALALGGFAGLRAIEIARLDWSEVGLGQRHPVIRVVAGKGGHGRIVPISTALAAILDEALDRRGPVITYRNGWTGHVPAHRVSGMVNRHLHEHGITETLHQLRHRFATVTYQACQDIRVVQLLLGHASPVTTAIYAQASGLETVRAVEAAGELDLPAAA